MKSRFLITGFFLVLFSLTAGIVITLIGLPSPAAAQTEDAPLRTILVTGRGQVNAQPDQATVRFGVQTEASAAAAAMEENNEQMTAVISATLGAGIEETDIQTQGLNLQPVYNNPDNGQAAELTGYRAINIVQVTVRDLTLLGTLLDAAVEAGSNTIESVEFQISNQAELEAAAREAAVTDAQQKAQQMTELAGATLGPVQTIVEIGGATPFQGEVLEESVASGVPIQPGMQAVQATVQVTWEIQ
jgi:uncharacterized protein